MIRSANLLKGGLLKFPKFNLFSLNKSNKIISVAKNEIALLCDLVKNKNLGLLKISRYCFSDKKDKEPEKKTEEEKKEEKKEENKSKGSEEQPENNPNDDKDDKSIFFLIININKKA